MRRDPDAAFGPWAAGLLLFGLLVWAFLTGGFFIHEPEASDLVAYSLLASILITSIFLSCDIAYDYVHIRRVFICGLLMTCCAVGEDVPEDLEANGTATNGLFADCVWACGLGLLLIVLFLMIHKPEKYKLPPGPPGLPVIGHLHLLDATAPYESLHQLSRMWGRIFTLRLGGLRCVAISDARLLRWVLNREEATGRAPLYLTHGIMQGRGIICSEGAVWAEQRLWLGGALRSLLRGRDAGREVAESIVHELTGGGAGDNGDWVDMGPVLGHHIGNFMNRLVFGIEYERDNELWTYLQQLRDEGVKLIGVCGAVNFLPWLRFWPPIARNIRWIREGQARTHQEYERIIQEAEAKLDVVANCNSGNNKDPNSNINSNINIQSNGGMDNNSKSSTSNKNSLSCSKTKINHSSDNNISNSNNSVSISGSNINSISSWNRSQSIGISSNCSSSNDNSGSHSNITGLYLQEMRRRAAGGSDLGSFTREQLYYLQADLFGAGTDTTMTSILWALLFLANRTTGKELQESIYQELLTADDQMSPSPSPLLRSTLLEVARVRPVTPLGVPHGTLSDLRVGDYVLPAGTMILPLHWSINRDPEVWYLPDKFFPERFLGPAGAELAGRLLPFQTGRRRCIGADLGKTLVDATVAALIREFEVELEPGLDVWHRPHHGFTLTPQPFKLRFKKREKC